MTYAPTIIDLSRVPPPDAIETLDFEALYDEFEALFLQAWEQLRTRDVNLPVFTALTLRSEPVGIVGEAAVAGRNKDRARVNDAFRALLPTLAKGNDLDTIVAGRNIIRQVIKPATETTPAVMQSDLSLLREYLLSYDSPAAGSAGRYLFDAEKAWPPSKDRTLGLWDARVNGRAIHGRRGETDLVIIGPFGRLPTAEELAVVRAAVTDPNRAPEACGITVMAAHRVEYQASLVIEVPGIGPSAEVLRQEAIQRVAKAATSRILIGGEIPPGFLAAAAYGDNVIRVRDLDPVAIQPDPYSAPVMTDLTIQVEVRA
ncbi:baseplate assembly protein [Rhizobium sp. SSA_523]|uniref:baseplate assembly protein n=1 Tax=Rhizobium sp. SSA_523 TaxID=2952477 RepID=UPI002091B479|nr:baseplate assembly protein [Rhizobium sp. SSA_523]MCO5730080.1 baseplate assembly protein [Rhizobium sp. SSA_523]WKC25145.1 baseplate assembly protein [Rhizobium sp. SSA_523]